MDRAIKSLQIGRGAAALAVAAFHLSLTMGDVRYGAHPAFQNLTSHGYLGVDFFFVLSGFIIIHAHSSDVGQPQYAGRYAWRRFSRVYPIYWILTAVFLAFVATHLSSSATLPKGGLLVWLSDFSLLRFSTSRPPLAPAWTLYHEVAFYVLFASLIFNRTLGLAALAVWFIVCAVNFQYPDDQLRSPWLVYTSAHNLNFLMGIGAWRAYRRNWNPHALIVAGGILFISAIAAEATHHPINTLLYAGSFAALIAAAAIFEHRQKWRVPNVLLLIGNASYSIYLTHEAAEGLALKMLRASHAPNANVSGMIYGGALLIALSFGVATYLLFEKPLLARFRSAAPAPPGEFKRAA